MAQRHKRATVKATVISSKKYLILLFPRCGNEAKREIETRFPTYHAMCEIQYVAKNDLLFLIKNMK